MTEYKHVCGIDCAWGCIAEATGEVVANTYSFADNISFRPSDETAPELGLGKYGTPFAEPEQEKYNTPFAEKVLAVTDAIAEMLVEKNISYGDAALNPLRIFSKSDRFEQLAVRMDDKLSRIARGTEFPGEDVIDDLIGYLILYKIGRMEGEDE